MRFSGTGPGRSRCREENDEKERLQASPHECRSPWSRARSDTLGNTGLGSPELNDRRAGALLLPFQKRFLSFSASTRYGTVTASGGIFLDGFRPASWKVGIRGERLNFEFPRDVQSEVDVDLEYLKSDSAELAHGSVVVRSAEYSRNLTVTDLIAEYLRLPDRAGVARVGEDSIDLNIQVRANNTLRVSNNLADLRGSADVTLRGTLASPVILGDLIIDEGRLFRIGSKPRSCRWQPGRA